MSALGDKDVPSAEQWQSAVKFVTSAVQKEIRSANEELDKLVGPKSFYDRWLRWRSQSEVEAKRQAIAEELTKFLNAEPVSAFAAFVALRLSTLYQTLTFLIGKELSNDVVSIPIVTPQQAVH